MTNITGETNAEVSEVPKPEVSDLAVDNKVNSENGGVKKPEVEKAEEKVKEKVDGENLKTDAEEEKVTYDGTKVVRVALKNKEDGNFIRSLESNGG